jgi:hypothetical protein
LSAATAIIGILIAGGIIDPEGTSATSKIVGFACAALASLGYTVSRTLVKKADAENS